jgi:predicted small secreted protein
MKILALLALLSMLAACNTVAGIGKDIQGSAEWTKDKMTKPSVDLNTK